MSPRSEPNREGGASRLARLESTQARLLLFASVVPRAVLSSRAAARRAPEGGIPAWTLGAREFGEAATDELFIAISALYRQVPELADVAQAVEACRKAAPELSSLAVEAAHQAPPPLRLLGLRRRRVGSVAFEQLEFESCPGLPAPFASAGYGQEEVAHARVLRHRDGPRPWVVWLHGAEQGRADDLFAFRVRHLLPRRAAARNGSVMDNDRMTLRRRARLQLHERWGGQVHWHSGGHIGHLWSRDVRSVVDRFLLDAH